MSQSKQTNSKSILGLKYYSSISLHGQNIVMMDIAKGLQRVHLLRNFGTFWHIGTVAVSVSHA